MEKNKHFRKTLKDKYYDIILQRLISDDYNAGDIITERSFVDEFNVSKSPVREALIALCKEGLLKNLPRFGYEVTPISSEKVVDMLTFRTVLECGYLNKYWGQITKAQIKTLQELLYQDYGRPEKKEILVHWQKSSNFHLRLFSFFKNQYAYDQLALTLRQLGIAYVRSYWNTFHTTNILIHADLHKQLLVYLLNGEKDDAIKCLEKDIAGFFVTENQK